MAERIRNRTSPLQWLRHVGVFVQEVRSESFRVVWPSRRETGLTTGMVFVLVIVAMIFLFIVDQILRFGIEWLVGLGR